MLRYLQEIFIYRDVLLEFITSDLKMKYKRTWLGYIWSLMNPVLQLSVLSFVFSRIVRFETKNYTLYLFSGLIIWNFIVKSITTASLSFLEYENIIKRIYIPKILLPLNKLFLRTIDLLFSFFALGLIVSLFGGLRLSMAMLFIPFAFILLFCLTLGFSIVASIVSVFFRDTQYLLEVFFQLAFYATPIFYEIKILPQKYLLLLTLNPFYYTIRLFQDIMYYQTIPSLREWTLAGIVSLCSLLFGLFMLKKTESSLMFSL